MICLRTAEGTAAVEKWRKMGVLAVEMETAALYATAASLGAKALSILTVSDHLFDRGRRYPQRSEKPDLRIWRNLHFHSRRKKRTEESYD